MSPPGRLEAVIYEIHRTAVALKCRCDSLNQGEDACAVNITSHKGPFSIPLGKCCLFVLIKQLQELRISKNFMEPAFQHSTMLALLPAPPEGLTLTTSPIFHSATVTYVSNKYFLSIYLAIGTIQRDIGD